MRKSSLIIIFSIILLFSGIRSYAQYSYGVLKAALIFQLAQHVNYPELENTSTLNIGFLNDSETYKEFDFFLKNNEISGKRASIQLLSEISEIGDLHILVVSKKHNKNISELWNISQAQNILLITDQCPDLKYVMINLHYNEQTSGFSFELNKSNFTATGFEFDTELLLLGGQEVDIIEIYREMRDSLDVMEQNLRHYISEIELKNNSILQQEDEITLSKIKIDSLHTSLSAIEQKTLINLDQYQIINDKLKSQQRVFNLISGQIKHGQILKDSLNRTVLSLEQQKQEHRMMLDSLIILGREQDKLLTEQADILSSKEDMIVLQSKFLIILALFGAAILLIVILTYQAFKNKHKLSTKLVHLVDERTAELAVAKNKAEESDRLKSAFIANISHEIRTPLNSILGFSELLTDNDLEDSDRQNYIGLVQSGGNQLLAIIGNIINISVIESGELEIQPEAFALHELLNNTYLKFKKLNQSDLIKFELVNNGPLEIISDTNRLNQILDNIIGNAFKYTEEGSITLGYKIIDKMVQFRVADTGEGISESASLKIFDRFYRVGNNKKTIPGTGLGLAITKSLVEKMGGRIWVEPNLPKGTIFYFTLPLD
ncbi:MAG: YfiR/HmsC family protein [Bacteroidota bacterium]|nr:YfiR/HmsC family protein [Bacteroidota bacterium]